MSHLIGYYLLDYPSPNRYSILVTVRPCTGDISTVRIYVRSAPEQEQGFGQ